MAKLIVKTDGNNITGFLNGDKYALSESNLDFLFEEFETAEIKHATINDNNDVTIIIDDNEILFENFEAFLNTDKYATFKKHFEDYANKEYEKDLAKAKNRVKNKKINRKKSVKGKVGKAAKLILIGILAVGAIKLGSHVYHSFDHGRANASLNEIVATAEPTEIPVIVDYSNFQAKMYTREEFDEIIINYANSKSVSKEKISLLLINNNSYDEARLNRYKTLVDYMAYFNENGYNIEILNAGFNNVSGIYAHNYSRYVILPENIEKIDSIVQINPSGDAGYYCYPDILDDIKSGNIPETIIVGSANSAPDFEHSANGNQLEKILKFSLEHGIKIYNVGVLGYNNSGETAFLNAGKLLEDYPNMFTRIVNLDGYYVTDFINKLNNILNGGTSDYANEINALLSNPIEIVNIIPGAGGYGISDSRPGEALNESKYLENVFNTTTIITNVASYKDLPNNAYLANVIGYLSGKISANELANNYQNGITIADGLQTYHPTMAASNPSYQGSTSYQEDYSGNGEIDYSALIQNYPWLFGEQGTEPETPTNTEYEDGDNSWASLYTGEEEDTLPQNEQPEEPLVEPQEEFTPEIEDPWDGYFIEYPVDQDYNDYGSDYSFGTFDIDDHNQNINTEEGPTIHF